MVNWFLCRSLRLLVVEMLRKIASLFPAPLEWVPVV
jgi:hypothetical protein